MVAAALAAIALGLLAVAGIAKFIDPEPTKGALAASGLPSSIHFVRTLAVVEMAAAAVGLAYGGSWALPGAVLYLGFMAFTAWSVYRKLPIQSCGCFGKEDTPPSNIHVVYNLIATVALSWVGMSGAAVIPLGLTTTEFVLYLALAALGVFASALALTRLPVLINLARTA